MECCNALFVFSVCHLTSKFRQRGIVNLTTRLSKSCGQLSDRSDCFSLMVVRIAIVYRAAYSHQPLEQSHLRRSRLLAPSSSVSCYQYVDLRLKFVTRFRLSACCLRLDKLQTRVAAFTHFLNAFAHMRFVDSLGSKKRSFSVGNP
jgi:hypothetical protein